MTANRRLRALVLSSAILAPFTLAPPICASAAETSSDPAAVAAAASEGGIVAQRALGERLATGLPVSAQNPLRRPDEAGALAAYRGAMAAGDRSPETLTAAARLAMSEGDRSAFQEFEPRLRQTAQRRDGEAAYLLALAAQQGWIGGPETPEAMMQAAAVMGSLSALLDIAREGGPTSATVRQVALAGLQAKVAAGSASAMVTLAHAYRDGILMPSDETAANRWLEAAAAAGHAPAMLELGVRLAAGVGAAADPSRARALLRDAAEAGSVAAAMRLGTDAIDAGVLGIGREEGRLWLSRALEVDAPGANVDLATLDLREALSADLSPEARADRLEAALGPVAEDADALAVLAGRFAKGKDGAALTGQILPLLHARTLEGSQPAGIAYDSWLRLKGATLPDDAAEALMASLRADADDGIAAAKYTMAALALDGRVGPAILPTEEAVRRLFEAADGQVGQAHLRIGRMYAFGRTFAQSPRFARRWLAQAAALDVEAARWLLADLLVRSEDPAEQAEGQRFYQERMQAGDGRAAAADIAYRLRTGRLTAQALDRAAQLAVTPATAVGLARALAKTGNPAVRTSIRRILDPFVGPHPDAEALVVFAETLLDTAANRKVEERQRGIAMLEEAVTLGSAEAGLTLAGIYLSNVAYAEHQPDAVRLAEGVLAQDPANTSARLLLSDAYLVGKGVKRDPVRAKELIGDVIVQSLSANPEAAILEADWLSFTDKGRDPTAAAALLDQQVARGSLAAERALGILYLNGFGPTHDADLAAYHLLRAAEAGDKEAMAAIGHLMINGMGTKRAPGDGLAWLERSAKAGNTVAMYDLSRIFALGSAGSRDEARSLYWLEQAATGGHPAATYQLGAAYLNGEGVPADRERARFWLARSQAAGNLLAARSLRQAEKAGALPDLNSDSE